VSAGNRQNAKAPIKDVVISLKTFWRKIKKINELSVRIKYPIKYVRYNPPNFTPINENNCGNIKLNGRPWGHDINAFLIYFNKSS
jgi:hypothetical protein